MMLRIFCLILFCFLAVTTHAWNAVGHTVVAQIAYDNLTPKTKKLCSKYLRARGNKSLNAKFVATAVWLDILRMRGLRWYDALHYIDTPFSTDGTNLPSIDSVNAVWGINNAITVLTSHKTNLADKQFALRVLIHVVGDLHQPLHAVTKVSHQLPHGDLGGNLFLLGSNNVGSNLHQYWDNGAGLYLNKINKNQVLALSQQLEQKWPCASFSSLGDPASWARGSYDIALNQVYQINPKETPDKQYQLNAQNTIQKQTALAGCRLAALLNNSL